MLNRVIRTVLVILPLTTCATRLHVHAVDPPDLTMEVTRCLRLISVAASKRHTVPDAQAELGRLTWPASLDTSSSNEKL